MSPPAIIAIKSLSLSLSLYISCADTNTKPQLDHFSIPLLNFLSSFYFLFYIKPLKPHSYSSLLSLSFSHFHSFIVTLFYLSFPFSSLRDPVLEENSMCNYSSTKPSSYESMFSTFGLPWPSKKHHRHLQLGLLNRRRAQLKELPKQRKRLVVVKSSSEIEMKNLKLYMENQSILEENEKLRKKAMLLHSENQALLSQLQKKVSEQNCSKTNH